MEIPLKRKSARRKIKHFPPSPLFFWVFLILLVVGFCSGRGYVVIMYLSVEPSSPLLSPGSFTGKVLLVQDFSVLRLSCPGAIASSAASATAELYCIFSVLLQFAEENQQHNQ